MLQPLFKDADNHFEVNYKICTRTEKKRNRNENVYCFTALNRMHACNKITQQMCAFRKININ